MNEKHKQIIEYAGIAAVIISLWFVIYEIRQSNRIALVTTEYEVRNNYSSLNESIINDAELAELIYRTESESYEVTGPEKIIIENYIFRSLNSWRPVVTSFENGLLGEVSYDAAFDDMRYNIDRYPAMRPVWRNIIENFPARQDDPIFRYIDQLLSERGH